MPPKPIRIPERIASIEFFPIIFWGRVSISTLGSFAVLEDRASREIPMPGRIVPPTYSFLLLTQSKVMAVPKSITIRGGLKRWQAAIELTILSAPTSEGLSVAMVISVFVV